VKSKITNTKRSEGT